jgi:hypothetical protein
MAYQTASYSFTMTRRNAFFAFSLSPGIEATSVSDRMNKRPSKIIGV